MHIAICDDMVAETDKVSSLLSTYQNERPGIDFHLHIYHCAKALLEAINSGQKFDMFLLDVMMPQVDGMQLAQTIRTFCKEVPLVFMTNSVGRALEAYSVFAMQYLLKPINKSDFFFVMDRIIAQRKQSQEKFMYLSAPGRNVSIMLSSIIVAENAGRVLKIHLENGDFIESKIIRSPFEVAIAGLLEDPRFLWVHQSYVINLNHAKELKNKLFVMNNDMEIPIPKTKFTAVKGSYLKYLAARRGDDNEIEK